MSEKPIPLITFSVRQAVSPECSILIKKKRIRDPLGPRVHEEASRAVSQKRQCYFHSQPVNFMKNVVEASPEPQDKGLDESIADNTVLEEAPTKVKANIWTKDKARKRAHAIQYIYEYIYFSPRVDSWEEMKLLEKICHRLQIHQRSKESVRRTLMSTISNISSPKVKRGRPVLIAEDSPEAAIVYDTLRKQLNINDATLAVNQYRASENLPLMLVSEN